MCAYLCQSSSDDDTVSSVSQERGSRGRRDSVVSCSNGVVDVAVNLSAFSFLIVLYWASIM